MWDIEVVKSAIVAAVVGFLGTSLFYKIVKIGIRKLVEKLTLSVGELKNQNILTQEQHDVAIAEVIKRETQLLDKVDDVLNKLPDAGDISDIAVYFNGIMNKIDVFLSEVDDE